MRTYAFLILTLAVLTTKSFAGISNHVGFTEECKLSAKSPDNEFFPGSSNGIIEVANISHRDFLSSPTDDPRIFIQVVMTKTPGQFSSAFRSYVVEALITKVEDTRYLFYEEPRDKQYDYFELTQSFNWKASEGDRYSTEVSGRVRNFSYAEPGRPYDLSLVVTRHIPNVTDGKVTYHDEVSNLYFECHDYNDDYIKKEYKSRGDTKIIFQR